MFDATWLAGDFSWLVLKSSHCLRLSASLLFSLSVCVVLFFLSQVILLVFSLTVSVSHLLIISLDCLF